MALVLGLLLLWLAPTHSMAQQTGQLIQEINISGNRKTPKETIKARIYSREGDVYDEAALQRDLRSVWNTGYFDDVRIEREQTTKGWIITFYVSEKKTIRTIEYKGLSSVSQSDVLDRYKKVKLPLTVDSPYDATKVIRQSCLTTTSCRARPPVCRRESTGPADSACLRWCDFQREGRPQDQSRQDRISGE